MSLNRLMPLASIPARARDAERRARATYSTRNDALKAARWAIVDGEGCYSSSEDRTTWGYVLTLDAAKSMCDVRANPPGGATHAPYSYEPR